MLGFCARASRISSLASGWGGPRYSLLRRAAERIKKAAALAYWLLAAGSWQLLAELLDRLPGPGLAAGCSCSRTHLRAGTGHGRLASGGTGSGSGTGGGWRLAAGGAWRWRLAAGAWRAGAGSHSCGLRLGCSGLWPACLLLLLLLEAFSF
jgi:hypothetical protein